MKYFFLLDTNGKRHIVVAQDQLNAVQIIENAELKKEDLYELQADTFDKPGFLISDK